MWAWKIYTPGQNSCQMIWLLAAGSRRCYVQAIKRLLRLFSCNDSDAVTSSRSGSICEVSCYGIIASSAYWFYMMVLCNVCVSSASSIKWYILFRPFQLLFSGFFSGEWIPSLMTCLKNMLSCKSITAQLARQEAELSEMPGKSFLWQVNHIQQVTTSQTLTTILQIIHRHQVDVFGWLLIIVYSIFCNVDFAAAGHS